MTNGRRNTKRRRLFKRGQYDRLCIIGIIHEAWWSCKGDLFHTDTRGGHEELVDRVLVGGGRDPGGPLHYDWMVPGGVA